MANQNHNTHILVVDDEANMRTTLADILLDEGYQVSTAEDGETAVKMCAENHYHVILMDVRMPGLDGVEAFRRIRRHQEGVKVIMMSAFGMADLKQIALEEGAIAFLDKPLDVEKVIRLIGDSQDTSILVVENDQQVTASLSQALKENHYHVTSVDSPFDALELVEQIRFDIIFIDVQLNSMNGLELYLLIKKITPSAVAIMISGKEEEFVKLARDAVSQTAYTIVHKPLDLDHLLNLLQRIQRQNVSNAIQKPTEEQK